MKPKNVKNTFLILNGEHRTSDSQSRCEQMKLHKHIQEILYSGHLLVIFACVLSSSLF